MIKYISTILFLVFLFNFEGNSRETDSLINNTEFEAFNEFEESEEFQDIDDLSDSNSLLNAHEKTILFRTLLALVVTILAGIAFRFANFRQLRFGILLASLVYFGFYSSGCPCIISSFQNFILFLLGEETQWIKIIWFLGIIIISYFFGKIWCGWVCHLGALQELIYRPKKKNLMFDPAMQKIFRVLQLTALFALLVQLIVTRTNLFIKIDPFKVAFNLFSINPVGYILLAILLVSSLLIYRPFCRGFCPVGLVLGWIDEIPGASKLSITRECKSCNQCLKDCSSYAINTTDRQLVLNNRKCIRCGECISSCKSGAIC